MEVRLLFQTVDESRERRFQGRVAKIFQAGAAPGARAQGLALQRPQSPADRVAQGFPL